MLDQACSVLSAYKPTDHSYKKKDKQLYSY